MTRDTWHVTHPVSELREPLGDDEPAVAQPRPREHRVGREVEEESEARGSGAHHGPGQGEHTHLIIFLHI